ncbi:hypothetical protein K7432_007302 [Basidiobolus ranarum]|uniref:NADP-dependent oxidoreductase domain-containing protein n=1 Tax=Basidiobolus ranarum TaxID=34480 RepID=A0ABR2W0A5_9FUNG
MEYRKLGNTGLKVSVLGLGSWLTYGGQVSQDVCYSCMTTAFKLGINYFDTAEVYGGGRAELAIGQVIKTAGWRRPDFVISTKIFWGGDGPNDRGLSRKHIVEGLNASLQRLQLEYVDLVLAHRPDPDTPMEEIVRAFNHVIHQGKALYWGTSEWGSQKITEAHMVSQRLGLIGPVLEQTQYNMFHRERIEAEYQPLFETLKMGTTIWSPLAVGILTGKYNNGIPEGSRLSGYENMALSRIRDSLATPEGQAKIDKVKELQPIAEKLGCTIAQLALAWTVKNSQVSSAIFGASNPEQVTDNVKALLILPKLTEEIMNEIEAVLQNKPFPMFNYRFR